MNFSRQLASLARAATSNSRDNGSDNNSNSNTSNGNNQDASPPPRRYNNDYNSYRGRGRHSYHPYNNSRGGRHNNYHNRLGGGQGQLTQAELEFYLPKLIEAIPKYQPITPTSSRNKSKRRHVALLFLTIDDLPFEHVWKAFLNNYKVDGSDYIAVNDNSSSGDQNNATEKNKTSTSNNLNQDIDPSLSNSDLIVSVLCHAKFPERVRSPWLQRRLLVSKVPNNRHNYNNRRNNNNRYVNRRHNDDHNNRNQQQHVRYHTRRPEWGSVDITRAMIDLLEEGLKIGKSKVHYDNDARYSYARYIANDDNDMNLNKDGSKGGNPQSMYSPSNDSIPEVDRFIFVSESCLPVVTLEEMEMALFGPAETNTNNIHDSNKRPKINQQDKSKVKTSSELTNKSYHEHYSGINANKSWLNAYNKPNNGYARLLQWDATSKAIPKNCIYKADQWIVLTRKHAWPLISLIDDAVKSVQQAFIRNQNNDGGHHHNSYQSYSNNFKVSLWQCFENVKASDEIYFPTAMALLGILNTATEEEDVEGDVTGKMNDSFEGEIAFKKVTYCDWSEKGKNPSSFVINKQKDSQYIELKERITMAREEGCLLGRKFIPGGNGLRYEDTISVQEWIKIVQNAVVTK